MRKINMKFTRVWGLAIAIFAIFVTALPLVIAAADQEDGAVIKDKFTGTNGTFPEGWTLSFPRAQFFLDEGACVQRFATATNTIQPRWTAPLAPGNVSWALENNQLRGMAVTGCGFPETRIAKGHDLGLKDYIATWDAKWIRGSGWGCLMFRVQDDTNHYRLCIAGEESEDPDVGILTPTHAVVLQKVVDGAFTNLKSIQTDIPAKTVVSLRLKARGSTIDVRANNKKLFTFTDATFSHGHIGLEIVDFEELPVDFYFDNVKVRTIEQDGDDDDGE